MLLEKKVKKQMILLSQKKYIALIPDETLQENVFKRTNEIKELNSEAILIGSCQFNGKSSCGLLTKILKLYYLLNAMTK